MANASYLRVTKSETRDLADHAYRERLASSSLVWAPSNNTLFTVFILVAAAVALVALVLR